MLFVCFTLIGAIIKFSFFLSLLCDRFGHIFHLTFYELADIEKILRRNATILSVTLDPTATPLIASRSRRTPRIANRLLKRIRDVAELENDGLINETIAKRALALLNIDEHGLDEVDRQLLTILIEKFSGGPTGLNTLAASVAEEMDTIETVYEPFLLQLGFIERTPRGRMATARAYEHLGFEVPKKQSLF
jgi:Holliday junction DNA helicase RuvB